MPLHLRPTCAAVLLAGAAAAAHGETTPYYIGSSLSYSHQSNVLGLADGQDVTPALTQLGYTSKSDNVTSLALVGGFDQQISRQRLYGDLTLRNNHYSRNDLLNNNSYALSGGLDWQTIERLSGKLTLRANRDLLRYSSVDQPTGVKNLVSTRQADLSARLGGVTDLTFEAGAGYRSVDYSDQRYDPSDNDQAYGSLGVRYWPSGATSFGTSVRQTHGRYPRYRTPTGGEIQADNFDRTDVDLAAWLELSGFTNLYARLSHTRLNYDLQDDFSGFTGLVSLNYQITGQVQVHGEFARDRGQDLRFVFVNPGAELVQAETASLVTAWRGNVRYDLTGKTSLTANLGYTRRPVNLNATPLFGGTGTQTDGRETRHQYGIGFTWTPTRTSQVGCDLSRERRKSDAVEQLNLSSNVTSCYAQLTLQP